MRDSAATSMRVVEVDDRRSTDVELETLDDIQRRVLWLAALMVHHANHVRPNPEKMKVGGHQASSASLVSIMTMLYFHYLRDGDRVAVKPHAAPVLHAIQYLLGNLPRSYLTRLRDYRGLQAYPSRTKDPDPVDFSTGSVGLGAVAPAFAALTHHYAQTHFGAVTSQRFVALLGDAELDEGNIWEAVLDPALKGLNNLLWIVDLNRQSLDRVIPDIKAAQLKQLFAECGWQVLEAKYGAELQRVFALPGGKVLQHCIDQMPNEEYQHLIRSPGADVRQHLAANAGKDGPTLLRALQGVTDEHLPTLLANLGGHDMQELSRVFAQADAGRDQPTIIFAYTIKGWGLPIAGDPLNHSSLLTPDQLEQLRTTLDVDADDPWAAFPVDSAAGKLCQQAAERLRDSGDTSHQSMPDATIPDDIGGNVPPRSSTQDGFGRLLTRLADIPEVGKRIVTTSPDVSISTNLAGWINKTGVFAPSERKIYELADAPRLIRWLPGPRGQHIELGISEMNFFMLLGQLGLSSELCGQLLFPIGTVYDPFVCRGLDAFIHGLYSGARFIVVGTPSGITLAPEGGAHQSTVTPDLGIALPQLQTFEPCFVRELEWMMLDALHKCADRTHGRSTYLRLSTRDIDQSLIQPALERYGADELRRQVLAGGYRLLDGAESCPEAEPGSGVILAGSGAVMPEVIAAARLLHDEGVAATVLSLTSPDRLFAGWRNASSNERHHLATLIPPAERATPIVTIMDGTSHALAWLGSVYGAPVTPLGVDEFGQSGTRADLYRHFGLDVDQIADVAFSAIESQ